jgi:ElaB/YqjD/DUF883 family membrane-anchored ribosome-binding protein
MDVENDSKRGSEEPASPIADATKKANNAIRDTAGTYLSKFGVSQDKLEVAIRERPVPCAAVAAAAGFVLGGGMATRPGLAILALFGRKAAKEVATNLTIGMVRAPLR